MLAFLLSPVGRWVAGLAIAGTLIGAADVYISIHEYNKGWHAAIAAVAKKDKEALDAVDKAVSNVDECVRRNGNWDTVNGVCG